MKINKKFLESYVSTAIVSTLSTVHSDVT